MKTLKVILTIATASVVVSLASCSASKAPVADTPPLDFGSK